MTAALTHLRRNISVFSRPENCPSVSYVVLISGDRLFHANGPATENLRGPSQLFWSAAQLGHPDLPSASVDMYE